MTNTVTVACKLPSGIILRVFQMVEHSEPVMGGGSKKVKVAHQMGKSVRIRGFAVPFGATPAVPIVGGYGLTPNVDAEFFDLWLKQNADSEIVQNNLIFAHEKQADAAAQAAEQAEIRSGLEPIDPKRLPKGIEPADRAAA